MWDWLARDMSLHDLRTAAAVIREMKAKLASDEWRRLFGAKPRRANRS